MEFLASNLRSIILSVLGIASLVLLIKYFGRIKKFLIEVRQELGKVSWSTRQELAGSTMVVIMITAIVAVFIGALDLFLSKILSVMFK